MFRWEVTISLSFCLLSLMPFCFYEDTFYCEITKRSDQNFFLKTLTQDRLIQKPHLQDIYFTVL